MNPLFPPPGNGGQNVTRNGRPQFGACLILSELTKKEYNRGFQCDVLRDRLPWSGKIERIDYW